MLEIQRCEAPTCSSMSRRDDDGCTGRAAADPGESAFLSESDRYILDVFFAFSTEHADRSIDSRLNGDIRAIDS